MNYILVDTENVGLTGLAKISAVCNEEDVFILFFTSNSNKVNLAALKTERPIKIMSIQVPVGKQSLDRHLISYLGYLLGRFELKGDSFFIISRDHDYNRICDYWNNSLKLKNTIKRFDSFDVFANNRKQKNTLSQNQEKIVKDIWFGGVVD